MAHQLGATFLAESLSQFRRYKQLAEHAIRQVTDDELTRIHAPQTNSVAVLVKHMAGHMRSRWTDFLVSDGEKPDRNRSSEFVDPPASHDVLMALWDDGWRRLFAAVEPLSGGELEQIVFIGGEPVAVAQAITRQLAHYAYHCGQIVVLAKQFRGSDWHPLGAHRSKPLRSGPHNLGSS